MLSQTYDPLIKTPHCAGVGSTCSIPPTQTTGTIVLRYKSDTIKKLTEANIKINNGIIPNPEFSFITTGDNEKEVDCIHSEIVMKVEATYYIP